MSGIVLEAYGNLARAVGQACKDIRDNGTEEVADDLEREWGEYTRALGISAGIKPARPDTDTAAVALVTGWHGLRAACVAAGVEGSDGFARMDRAAAAAEKLLGLVPLTPAGG